jgi:hypothetical protein
MKTPIIIAAVAIVAIATIVGTLYYQTCLAAPSFEELTSAPEQIEIKGREYTLEAFLWRDYMPNSPPDGKPLVASIRITANDSLNFPASVNAGKLWVIKNSGEIWQTAFTSEQPTPPNNCQLEKIAREGPKWDPNTRADVVVRVTCEGNTYLLRAANQTIKQTA